MTDSLQSDKIETRNNCEKGMVTFMRMEEAFGILGMEPVKDEALIRNAYRRKLTVTNPEDDQEGFMRLRSAYDEALAYCKKDREEKEEETDDSPSGHWAAKAAELYGHLSLRCDEEKWRALFDEEVFLSLEENEECRRKLLIFLMNHIQFPQKIWQLFDKKLDIRRDTARLKEEFPAEFVRYLVQRCSEQESFDYTLFEGEDDGDYDGFLKYYRESLNAVNEQDYPKALEGIEKGEKTGISHPYMEIIRALVYRNTGREDEAEGLLCNLLERYPENIVILHHMADFYWEKGQKEEAATCYKKIKESDDENGTANYRLSFYYHEKGEEDRARSCILLVPHFHYNQELMELLKKIQIDLIPKLQEKWEKDGDILAALELAGCYYHEERYFAAEKVLDSIRERVPDDQAARYWELLSKVYLGGAESGESLGAIEKWTTLIGADDTDKQSLAGKLKISAYHNMARGSAGYFKDAVAEYEKRKAYLDEDPNFLIEIAQIYLEMGEYQKCLDLAGTLLEWYQVTYAYVLMLKSYARLWDASGVIENGKQCISCFPDYAYPYEEMAKVYYDTGHKEELEELLKQAQENKVESIYLDNCIYHGGEVPEDYPIQKNLDDFDVFYEAKIPNTGKLKFYRKGYPVITGYLKLYPCNFLLNKRGLFSMAAKDAEAAMKDFQKVLERDPADAFAHNNIGCLYKYAGEYEKALPYFKRAVYYMYREEKKEPSAVHYGNLAHVYELLGEYALAAKTYRVIYDQFNRDEETVRDLSANYARSGEFKLAKEIVGKLSCDKRQKELLRYRIYLYAGLQEQALGCIDQVKQSMPIKYYHILAWDFLLKGQKKEAIASMERADKNFGAAYTTTMGRKKEKMDIALNRIFFLTFGEDEITACTPDEEEQEKAAGIGKLSALFGKVLGGNKKEALAKSAGLNEASREMSKAVAALRATVKQLCGNNPDTGEDAGIVATEEFFYKERYVKFVEFILALYGKGNKAGEEALKAMEESPRCRLCNQASCMRLAMAKALLLEQQGKKQEAKEVCRELLREQPYNLYAKAKL